MRAKFWVSIGVAVALVFAVSGAHGAPQKFAEVGQGNGLFNAIHMTEITGAVQLSETFPQPRVLRAFTSWGTDGNDHLSIGQQRQMYFSRTLEKRTDMVSPSETAAAYFLDVDVAKLVFTDHDRGDRLLTYDLDITYTLRDKDTGSVIVEYQDVANVTEEWGYQDLDVAIIVIWENAIVGSLKRVVPNLTAVVP